MLDLTTSLVSIRSHLRYRTIYIYWSIRFPLRCRTVSILIST